MKQLIQNFKTGELYVDEVPMPSISEGMVLVENDFSLISAGTERSTVKVAQASLLGKAKQRPDLVAQVLQNIKKEGLSATIGKVKTKLDSLKALGYSTSGKVIASLDKNGIFKPGDRVACGGQDYASHAEVVAVPQNLVVKIPDNVSSEEAAFTTLGAIALQGVRQANPTIGENICVIGLGLLGQITCQLLNANGCRVFGIDISRDSVEFTKKLKYVAAYERADDNLMQSALHFSNGHGFDKVIITASAPTNDPMVLATELLRKKGSIILVGAVKIEIPRDPYFYRKELDLKISCSYGPGRYDVNYEEEGNDYPIGYVRWTEQRNMEAFLELVSIGKLDLKPLITHTFDIENGVDAYDIILGKKKEPFIGILLKYNNIVDPGKSLIKVKPLVRESVNAGFIGAGSFAQSYLLPNLKSSCSFDTVVTKTGISSKNVAQKFGFANASTNPDDVLSNEAINTVFIATQHDTHADYVIRALEKGKAVFVEKPLALSYEELESVKETYTKFPGTLLVGYNRRFADVVIAAKKEFSTVLEPIVMNFRINAGFIPKEHWTQRAAGGGRILGEICHFVDLMSFLSDSDPESVFAQSINSKNESLQNDDNIIISIRFKNGSIGSLVYVANGDKGLAKERIEISGGNISYVIDDFKSGTLYRNNKSSKIQSAGKGHKREVENFINAVKEGKESPIAFESLYLTTLTTLKIIDSLSTGLPQIIAA